jgi:hypothetical protein
VKGSSTIREKTKRSAVQQQVGPKILISGDHSASKSRDKHSINHNQHMYTSIGSTINQMKSGVTTKSNAAAAVQVFTS